MGKRPSFQFYPADWLSSTHIALMTLEQEGAYMRLLCHCWMDQDCSLPDDDEALAALSGMGEGWLKGGCRLVADCFVPFPNRTGRITNNRLLEERAKQDEWKAKSAAGGKKSAESRRLKRVKGGSDLVATKRQPNGNSSSSSSSSSSSKTTVSGKKEKKATKRPGTNLLQCYYDLHVELKGHPPTVAWKGKDLNTAEQLLKGPPVRTVEELEPQLRAYLQMTDAYISEAGWPFALFPSRLQKLQTGKKQLDLSPTTDPAAYDGLEDIPFE